MMASNAMPRTPPRSMTALIWSSANWRFHGRERAAVLMAGPERAVVEVERVPEAFVAEVRDVENDAEPLHLLEQIVAGRRQRPFGVGAVRVAAGAVVRRAERPQAVCVAALQVLRA